MAQVFWTILAVILTTLGVNGQINWCQMEAQYCSGSEHIACQPNSFPMGQNVRNIQIIPMLPSLIQAGVDRHNYHRSNVAAGRVWGIPSATTMQQMTWHSDLAFVAAEHARHANFQHDQCRSFSEFPFSGQNLAIRWSSQPFSDYTGEFISFIDMWYDDEMPIVRDQMPGCINNFQSACLPAGHFTVMVKENNRALGCALVSFEQFMSNSWWYAMMVTCNYAETNMLNQRIFATGTPCSGCGAIGRQCDASTSLCV
ncbi:antigen 5 like allergen Cul n 1-like [Lutzomyia longipalpis]|uniref:antigen 5 like allergen Cul n 1-like n=1 Tax=Lutzomyia longipalpis TaxID=7200 RepID=UPI00248401B5|nr:antigen 5 like allergen Cul n 1-like [Lutzomyia longipalpis]